MSKKKHRAFSREFYLKFNIADWLNDPGLKMCPDDAKGFWIDLLCHLPKLFPYGHLSIRSDKKIKLNERAARIVGGVNPQDNPDPNPAPNREDDLWANLSLNLTVNEQLEIAISIEKRLPELMGKTKEKVSEYLEILEELNIFSRTEDGIIYSRRLVADFERRKSGYINGSKGGNPKILKRKSRKKLQLSNGEDQQITHGITGGLTPPINPQDNGSGEPGAEKPDNPVLNYNYNSVDVVSSSSIKGKVDNENSVTGNLPGNEKKEKPTTTGHAVVSFEDLRAFKGKFLADRSITEPLFMNTGIDPKYLPTWLDLFNLNCVMQGKMDKDYREYLSHFRYWIFKRDYKNPPPDPAPKIKTKAGSFVNSADIIGKYQRPNPGSTQAGA